MTNDNIYINTNNVQEVSKYIKIKSSILYDNLKDVNEQFKNLEENYYSKVLDKIITSYYSLDKELNEEIQKLLDFANTIMQIGQNSEIIENKNTVLADVFK